MRLTELSHHLGGRDGKILGDGGLHAVHRKRGGDQILHDLSRAAAGGRAGGRVWGVGAEIGDAWPLVQAKTGSELCGTSRGCLPSRNPANSRCPPQPLARATMATHLRVGQAQRVGHDFLASRSAKHGEHDLRDQSAVGRRPILSIRQSVQRGVQCLAGGGCTVLALPGGERAQEHLGDRIGLRAHASASTGTAAAAADGMLGAARRGLWHILAGDLGDELLSDGREHGDGLGSVQRCLSSAEVSGELAEDTVMMLRIAVSPPAQVDDGQCQRPAKRHRRKQQAARQPHDVRCAKARPTARRFGEIPLFQKYTLLE